MITSILLLVGGFVILVFGADRMVDGAAALARRLGIPDIVIGLTIVAFGTSAPELVVNVFASLSGNTGIVLGNVLGSNIFNTLAILGIAAIIYPLSVKTQTTWIEIPLSLLAGLVILVMASDHWIDRTNEGVVLQSEGILLLLFFFIFLGYNISSTLSGKSQEEVDAPEYSLLKSILFLLLGLALLIISGRMIVTGAESIAGQLGIPDRIIGLTVISVCTSLPELATSIVAARKRKVDMALGNVVGSNIFNIFLIMGASAIANPVTVGPGSSIDMLVYIFASLLLFLFIFTGKGRRLEMWEGLIFLLLYVGYMAWLVTGTL